MSRRLRLVVLGGLAASSTFAAGPGPGPTPAAEVQRTATALAENAFRGTRAADWVRSLTDAAGPRPAGSTGDAAAVAWALETMRSIGLVNVRAEPVTVAVWRRGVETGEIVSPHRQPLALAALGGSVATPPDGLEAEVLRVTTLEELEGMGAGAAKGKIVFFDKPMERTIDGSGYGRAVDVRSEGASVAARAGAVGVVIRSIGTDQNRTPHTGAMKYDDDAPKIPAAALSIPDAALLARLLAAGKPVRLRFRLDCGDAPPGRSANVVGEVPGQGKNSEIVLLGAHLDSWDLGTGAIDDGAGCGIVLEAARLIALLPRRPERTVRVVLYANEEHGNDGGKTYRVAHAAELPRHVAAFEADSGTGAPLALSWLAGPLSERGLRSLLETLAPLGVGALESGGSGGVDVGPLREDGVPQFSFQQDRSTYFDFHHTANDTFDRIEPGPLDRMAAATAAFAYFAATTPEPFERIPAEKRKEEEPKRRRR
jgi:carboxypeptidase Q